MNFKSFKTTPYKHQQEAYDFLNNRKEAALFCEMGTGKSKMLLDDIARLAYSGEITGAIIVAPKGVYMNWINKEIPTHFSTAVPYRVFCWDRGIKKLDGGHENYKLTFLIINTEAFSFSKEKLTHVLNEFCRKYNFLIAVDESSTIKNHKSMRTKNLTKLSRSAKYRRILTGTPITNSPLDVYAQSEFLKTNALGFSSYYAFRNHYAILKLMDFGPGRKSFAKVIGYRHIDNLVEKLSTFSFIATKDKCLDLPPKIYHERDCEMSKEQTDAYNEMKKKLSLELNENLITASNALVKILKLHQIACGFISAEDGNKFYFGKNYRLEQCVELLSECDKVIIWANYKENIRQLDLAIRKEYGDDSLVCYHGDISTEKRQEAVVNFQEGDARFFLATQQTAGYGLTLTAASTIVYYSNNYSLDQRQQSEDRAHRIGQKKSVNYIDLISRGTIDEKIISALKQKKQFQDLIVKDGLERLQELL